MSPFGMYYSDERDPRNLRIRVDYSSEMITSYTGDRREFLERGGSVQSPRGIFRKLSCNTGFSSDTCGVIQVSVAIRPAETKTVIFGLGYGHSERLEQINLIRYKYKDITKVWEELNKVKAYWNDDFIPVCEYQKDEEYAKELEIK